ncbi:MAG: hydroxymethylbilane synthase [Crocinitomicaceae bacterium]|nr:hydroxymethylbilane synthase [Crocinitomicaceae bacterium]
MKITIGSRGSDLALWQAHYVEEQLVGLGHEVEIKIIQTQGDKIQHLSFDKMEGKGFFTKEIEAALLSKEIDLAVHSHKDLETTPPEGLRIAAVSYRENPTDTLLIREEAFDEIMLLELKENPIVGTSSARRQTQLKSLRSDIELKDLRGNVPTRIQKLRDGQYDAIVVATAGIKRLELDLSDLKVLELSPTLFIPAPAQGVLGLQIREDDHELNEALQAIHNEDVAEVIEIERAVLKQMDGGCQLPLGVYCIKELEEWIVYTSFAQDKSSEAEVNSYQSTQKEGLVDTIVDDLKDGIS